MSEIAPPVRAMRILLLSWNYPPTVGGIEQVAGNLTRELAAAGHEVRVLTRRAEGAPAASEVLRARRPRLAGFLAFAFGAGYRLAKNWRPDLLVCTSLVPAPAAWPLALRFRLPWVVLVHGSDLLHPGRIYRTGVRFLLRRATRVAANSSPTAALLAGFGVAPERVAVIHPGVARPTEPPEHEAAVPRLLAGLEGRRVLLSVGRLVRRKGLLEFVERVMPAVARRCPDALLLLVGDDADESLVHRERMRARIEAAVHRLGLGPNVRLLGRRSDAEVQALYRRADLFVMPGIEVPGDVEGFGIVLLEAALAGVPALATRTGGVPEAVVDGATGWLVPPGDPAALIDAACRLLEAPEERRRLGRAAERRAREEFSWAAVSARYLDLFAATVAARRHPGRD